MKQSDYQHTICQYARAIIMICFLIISAGSDNKHESAALMLIWKMIRHISNWKHWLYEQVLPACIPQNQQAVYTPQQYMLLSW